MFNIHTDEGVGLTEDFWSKEIARVGGKEAYAELLAVYATSTPGDQHTVAHIFGRSLYLQEGEAGLPVCDTSFAFGCFHEFLGNVIKAQGLSSVDGLNEACFKALGPGTALSCAHGLGHGVQSYLGYELEDLKKGLSICANVSYSDPIGGCPGGLFMEFNMRTMQSIAGVPMRPLNPGGIMYPCNSLEASDVSLCYFWQPQWWLQLLKSEGNSSEESFRKVGDLCATLPQASILRCFAGAGTVVGISAEYDIAKGIKLCRIAAETEDAEGSCISSAAGSYFAEQSIRQKASELCEGLQEPWMSQCTAAATGNSLMSRDMRED